MKYVVVLVAASSHAEGEKIANALLNAKLAACVNIADDLKSFFWWQGSIDTAFESLLIIKTKKDKLKRLFKVIKENHSYDVPEMIALPIIDGSADYLKWLENSVKESKCQRVKV